MPRKRSDAEPNGRVRTMYELRRFVRVRGLADLVDRRYFDEDERALALTTRDMWERELPAVGTEYEAKTHGGNLAAGVVAWVGVELLTGKALVSGQDSWHWISSLDQVEEVSGG